nr:polyadenylate-binding protein 2 [Jaculus jaculus]
MATPASAPDTRALVADFVGYKLRQKGYVCGAGPGEGPAADPLHQAMRAAGDEFETRFRRTFSDLAAQLHVTPGSAQQRFTQVSDELFQGGPNWGRLVAFFVFGAALCAESVNKEMEPLVGQVQEWMVAYLETRLADWIHSSGGWAEFTALYGDGALEEARRLREGNWASVRTVLTGAVALGALVTVGAFFASKSQISLISQVQMSENFPGEIPPMSEREVGSWEIAENDRWHLDPPINAYFDQQISNRICVRSVLCMLPFRDANITAMAAAAAAAAAAGAAGGRGSGPGRRRHLVPGAGGEAGEGDPGGAGDYGNGLESEELEPGELLPEPEPEEEPPRPRAPPGAPGPGPGSAAPGSQEEEEEPGLVEGDPGDGAIEDPELEAIKARVREMEEEAEKLKELQNEVEKQMNMSPPPGNAGPVIMSIEEKMEADARSIYVGNVDYGATAEELEAHFHGCGSVNRVTILCDKFSGHPKGFAYIEFSDKESVRTSLALDESLFRGRQIKVIPKRTNRPGISTTDRGFPRARYRARTTNYNSSRSRFYSGFNSRPRGRVYRGRARATSWYSPY